MRKLVLLLVVAAFVVTATSAFAASVAMVSQNNSGQDGTATLEAVGDQTMVTVTIKPGAPGVSQPAHIHNGTCANMDPVPMFPLNPVVDGTSTTTVNAPLATIQSQARVVNVHKSAQEIATSVSCGQLPM